MAFLPLSRQTIAETFSVTPLLAAFACAVAGDSWRDPILLNDPDTARHLLE